MKKIVKAALMHGVKFFAASHRAFNPLAKVHLEALKEVASEDSMEVKIISCVDVPLRKKKELMISKGGKPTWNTRP